MARLIYIANVTLDGYTEDASGSFDFTQPSQEVFEFITHLIRPPLRTQILGRRMYETMAVWETEPAFAAASAHEAEFARLWQETDKLVYSTTLTEPVTARTRIERAFDPEVVRAMKDADDGDLSIAGPTLAAHAFRAGLVDDIHLFVSPVTVGRGKAALPTDARLELELVDERRFDSGTVYLHHSVRN